MATPEFGLPWEALNIAKLINHRPYPLSLAYKSPIKRALVADALLRVTGIPKNTLVRATRDVFRYSPPFPVG